MTRFALSYRVTSTDEECELLENHDDGRLVVLQ